MTGRGHETTVSRGLIERLDAATCLAEQVCSLRWRRLLQSREGFRDYLIATYHYVVCSVPLMEKALLAGIHVEVPGLGEYLRRHIEEERNHDEWLLDDLGAMGVSAENVRKTLPPPAVSRLAGAQYYLIHHVHPASVLGYMYVLESSPPDRLFLENARRRLGLDRQAFRTLFVHAKEDIHHRREMSEFLETIPSRGRCADVVVYSAQLAALALLDLIDSLDSVTHEGRSRLSPAH